MAEFTIPELITVHIGAPSSSGQNITLPFADYIKNVASSEIYPTWPENAIRANVYAQITYALNRVFTEKYRAQGYDFDITNNTAFDQYFVPNRDVFENISNIVDEIFNSYISRQGTTGPIFSAYCNGTTVTCAGLSQWGSVPLSKRGLVPFEILQEYYGDDINLNTNVKVAPNVPSFGEIPIGLGDKSEAVVAIQSRLNEVGTNYPSIPKIFPVDGVFGQNTLSAVKQFQKIFGLTADGIVGASTWYKLIGISNAVRRLSELNSKGLTIEEYNQQFPDVLRVGDRGRTIEVLQYYLSVVGSYYNEIPTITQNGIFDDETKNAVIAFQKSFGLEPDGIVGLNTWQELYRAYLGVLPLFKSDSNGSKINEGQFAGYTLRNEG